MSINKRNSMLPGSGLLYDKNGNVVDYTEIIKTFSTFLSGFLNETIEVSTIAKRHHEIHHGNFYSVGSIVTIPAEDELNFIGRIKGKDMHLIPAIVVTSKEDVEIYAYENFTATANEGAAIEIQGVNHNRKCGNLSESRLLANITVSDYGDQIYTDFVPGSTGIGGMAAGGQSKEVEEWILGKNTDTLFRMINNSSEDNKCGLFFSWYDEDV